MQNPRRYPQTLDVNNEKRRAGPADVRKSPELRGCAETESNPRSVCSTAEGNTVFEENMRVVSGEQDLEG
jgi:hypothetical protein